MDKLDLPQAIKSLSQRRNQVGLLIENERGAFIRMWRNHSILEVNLLDLIDDLLVEIVQRSDVMLGTFYEDDFHYWLVERIQNNLNWNVVICTQLDSLLATCVKPKAQEFFANFAMRNYTIPVFFVTAQQALVRGSKFPPEQIWGVEEMEAT